MTSLSMTKLLELTDKSCNAAVSPRPDALIVSLEGFFESRVADALKSFLGEVGVLATRQGIHRLEIDFTKAEFLTSTCISRILRFMVGLNDKPVGRPCEIVLRAKTTAQLRTLQSMQRIAPYCTTVEGAAEDAGDRS